MPTGHNCPNGSQDRTTEAPGDRRRHLEHRWPTSSAPLTCQVKPVFLTFCFPPTTSHPCTKMRRRFSNLNRTEPDRPRRRSSMPPEAAESFMFAGGPDAARHETIH